MSDNKKYYYLKLKDNFFDSDEIKILEQMKNGYKYSNLLLKLYLKSLKFDGALRLNEYIPYNIEMISAIVGMDIDTVKVAFELFKQLKLIEILEDGTIYMLQIQNYIGTSSTEGDRKREYRKRIESNKSLPVGQTSGQMSGQKSDIHPPEIEIEKEIEKELKIDINSIKNAWNFLNLSSIVSIKNQRLKHTKARIKEVGEKEFIKAIESINQSSFLQGKNNRGWVISYDWFVNPNNFTKVIEGKYIDKQEEKKEKQTEWHGVWDVDKDFGDEDWEEV